MHVSVPTYGNAFRGARFEISPVESVCSSSKEDNDERSGSNVSHDCNSDRSKRSIDDSNLKKETTRVIVVRYVNANVLPCRPASCRLVGTPSAPSDSQECTSNIVRAVHQVA